MSRDEHELARWFADRDEATAAPLRAEIKRLQARLYEVDAQLTAEDHIHARECMALRADNELLRAALEQAVDDFGWGHSVYEQTKQECIAALKSKP